MAVEIAVLLEMLRREYGDPDWWPGDSQFEVAVGAVLTQRTSWANAEASLKALKSASLLHPAAMAISKTSSLEEIIQPSGFYRQKARCLKSFSKLVVEGYGGELERMNHEPAEALRYKLIAISGIGPETADSILLYALGKARFVVDAYTYRLMARLGWKRLGDYDSLQAVFEQALKSDVKALMDMHALIVIHCKTKCAKSPDCPGCVLGSVCGSYRE